MLPSHPVSTILYQYVCKDCKGQFSGKPDLSKCPLCQSAHIRPTREMTYEGGILKALKKIGR